MKTKGLICRGRARTIEDAVEAWKSDHDEAMAVRDLEDIIRECRWLRDLLMEWNQESWKLLRAGRLHCVQDTGDSLRMVLTIFLRAIPRARRLAANYKRGGYHVEHAGEFADLEKQVQEMANELDQKWPFIDPREMEESRSAYDRGECQPVEDILRELQGTDSAERQAGDQFMAGSPRNSG